MAGKDINYIMSAMIGKLVPVCAVGANPELWRIYDEMQSWVILTELRVPGLTRANPVTAARNILRKVAKLRDRALAKDIESVIRRHTPALAR